MPKPKTPSRKSLLEESFAAEMKIFGLPDPARQFRFHPSRQWRFDFAWPDLMCAVELQGGIYIFGGGKNSGGGHNRGGYMEQSFEKMNEAQKLGWRVYQFGPSQIRGKKRTNSSSPALAFLYPILAEKKPLAVSA